MDSNDVSRWFDEYLGAFASCGRGEAETASLLSHYGVPLLLTTNDGFFALTTREQIVGAVQTQIDGMRAAGFARTEVLGSEVAVVNAKSALLRGTFCYRNGAGDEMRRLTVSYLITDGAAGRRISVLAVHAAVNGPAARP